METSVGANELKPGAGAERAVEQGAVRVQWAGVGLFLLLAFGISWLMFIGLRALGLPLTVYAAVGMFGPALAALLTRLIRHEGFADAGLRLGRKGQKGTWRIYLAAYLTIPILLLLGMGIALLSTYQHWALPQNIHILGNALTGRIKSMGAKNTSGLTGDSLGWLTFYAELAESLTLAIVINAVFTFGEEFGWRGYLLPRLAPLGGIPAALLVGAIWGLWHAPLIVLDGYNYPGHPWVGVAMMMLFCIALNCFMAWLRFRAGSIWPTVLAHAALNGQAGLIILMLSSGNSLLRAPIGLLGLVPMILLAIFLAATGRLKPQI